MRGILKTPTAGHDAKNRFFYNIAATTVVESEVHNSSTGNDTVDDFTLATAMEASNVEVRTNLALVFLATGNPNALVVS
jgi:hypothetical protein